MDFKYNILDFDETNRTVTVKLADGGTVAIQLTLPFPTTPEELDAIVRRYAMPAEIIEAKQAQPDDLQFLQELVGTERVTSRTQLLTLAQPAPVKTEAEIRADLWERIKQIRQQRIAGVGYAGVKVDGTWFYADNPFRTVITSALRLYPLDKLPADDPLHMSVADKLAELKASRWKTMNGEFVVPSYELAIKIDAAHAVLLARCHLRGEQLRALVEGAQDPTTVNINSGWPPTYGEE